MATQQIRSPPHRTFGHMEAIKSVLIFLQLIYVYLLFQTPKAQLDAYVACLSACLKICGEQVAIAVLVLTLVYCLLEIVAISREWFLTSFLCAVIDWISISLSLDQDMKSQKFIHIPYLLVAIPFATMMLYFTFMLDIKRQAIASYRTIANSKPAEKDEKAPILV